MGLMSFIYVDWLPKQLLAAVAGVGVGAASGGHRAGQKIH